MEDRKAELNLVVGINGTGKTTWLEKNIVNNGKKCLIITPDPMEWKQIPEIRYEDIRTLNGVGKIIYSDSKTLEKIKSNYSGGALILDDAMSYLDEQTPSVLQFLYIRRRQRGVDIYIVAHGLRQIPPKAFTFASWLILFNSVENFQMRKKELLPDTFEKIIKAQTEISKKVVQGFPYHYKIILLDQQIKGSYVAAKKQNI